MRNINIKEIIKNTNIETDIENIFSLNLCEKIVSILEINNKFISCGESCTGGMIASNLIDISGCSNVFKESFITYSNLSKTNRLGVSPVSLENFGAVSPEVAWEMAKGAATTSKSDFGISSTGIAGPLGGSIEKPVGLVYLGFYFNDIYAAKKCLFNGSRMDIRQLSTYNSLNITLNILTNLFDID